MSALSAAGDTARSRPCFASIGAKMHGRLLASFLLLLNGCTCGLSGTETVGMRGAGIDLAAAAAGRSGATGATGATTQGRRLEEEDEYVDPLEVRRPFSRPNQPRAAAGLTASVTASAAARLLRPSHHFWWRSQSDYWAVKLGSVLPLVARRLASGSPVAAG